jgi:hypothetical protein
MELVERSDCSARLKHCVKQATLSWRIPYRKVSGYLKADKWGNAKHEMMKTPNFGKVTVNELDALIRRESLKNTAISLTTEALSFKIIDVVNSLANSSEKLRNCIQRGCPFETIGEYLRAEELGKKTMIKGTPGFGEVALREFDALLRNNSEAINALNTIEISLHTLIFDEPPKNVFDPSDYLTTSENNLKGILETLSLLIEKITLDSNNDFLNNSSSLPFSRSHQFFSRDAIILDCLRKKLDDRELDIVNCRAVEGSTLKEVALKHSLSRQRVAQLEAIAREKLLISFSYIAMELDNILDISNGDVSTLDVSKALGVEINTVKLLVFICGKQSKEKIHIKGKYLSRSTTQR